MQESDSSTGPTPNIPRLPTTRRLQHRPHAQYSTPAHHPKTSAPAPRPIFHACPPPEDSSTGPTPNIPRLPITRRLQHRPHAQYSTPAHHPKTPAPDPRPIFHACPPPEDSSTGPTPNIPRLPTTRRLQHRPHAQYSTPAHHPKTPAPAPRPIFHACPSPEDSCTTCWPH
nr:predicted GPI-anchored protein 58 [Procambarus clarkii]